MKVLRILICPICLALIALILYPPSLLLSSSSQNHKEELAGILKKAQDYCQRLDVVALDFVCMEEITERIDTSRDGYTKDLALYFNNRGVAGVPGRTRISHNRAVVAHSFRYDFQFIRKGRQVKERRILLEEDGVAKNEENAPLKSKYFKYQDILLGPARILGSDKKELYEYRVEGEETIGEHRILIVGVRPKDMNKDILYGKAWIRESDGAVLKIEWAPESIGNYQVIEEVGKTLKLTPDVFSVSEFAFEKNGICFPSRDVTEEAYKNKRGRRFVRSETTVVYNNYKFFTVGVETKIKK